MSQQRWLKNTEVAELFGTTVMTVHRWRNDPALGFPQPSLINGKPYTDIQELNDWMRSRIADRTAKEVAA